MTSRLRIIVGYAIAVVLVIVIAGIILAVVSPAKGVWLKRAVFGGGERVDNETTKLNETDRPLSGSFNIPSGDSLEHMAIDGQPRTYTAYVPESILSSTESVDVLFVLHGTDQTSEYIRNITGFDAYADENGFVVVYPDALERSGKLQWDPTNQRNKDITFIEAIIEELNKLSGGRINNIYVAGFSNGSVMAQAIGCMVPEVDGIAPVAAGMGSQMLPYCSFYRVLPYIGFYGTVDRSNELEIYETSLTHFATENGCATTYQSESLPNVDPNDGTAVELRMYSGKDKAVCAVPMHYYRIEGGGHYWPGSETYTAAELGRQPGKRTLDIDATKLIVDFFGL